MKESEIVDNGGPAFPNQRLGSDGLPISEAWDGMSLRDYFAASALRGMMANNELLPNSISAACKEAFLYADAMIEARITNRQENKKERG